MSDTIHRIVTERMIAALERGTIPWRKPWHAEAGRPRSMNSGRPYRGVNVFLLGLTAAEQGYASPYWGTYRQISNLGGQIRRGERSTLVIFWKQAERTERDPQTSEPTIRQLPVLRYYRVFNAAQADNLPERFHPVPGQDTEMAEPQAVLDRYLADGPKLLHVAGDWAAYNPSTDTIRLPLRTQFRTPEHYYATAFHEAGHSTGHPERLNRPGIAGFDHFGSGKYAKEELIAQMTSSMVCAQTGTDTPQVFDESASYIAGWLHALNDDKRLVITAAAHAQRASDLIAEPEHQAARDNDRYLEAAPSRGEEAPAASTVSEAGSHQDSYGIRRRAVAASEYGDPADLPLVPAEPQSPPPTRAAATATERERATTPANDWQAEAG
jgi:antirestriction protein ArdC